MRRYADYHRIVSLHNNEDNMTFKDEIDRAGERYWENAYEDRQTDVIDVCVEKIDELEQDLEKLSCRVKDLVDNVSNLHYQYGQVLGGLDNIKAPQVPSDRYCDLFEQLMAAIGDRNKPEPEPKTEV